MNPLFHGSTECEHCSELSVLQVDLSIARNGRLWQLLQNQTLEQRWLVNSCSYLIYVSLIACFQKRGCCLQLLRQTFWQEAVVQIEKKAGAFVGMGVSTGS